MRQMKVNPSVVTHIAIMNLMQNQHVLLDGLLGIRESSYGRDGLERGADCLYLSLN